MDGKRKKKIGRDRAGEKTKKERNERKKERKEKERQRKIGR